MKINTIYNEPCEKTLEKMINENKKVSLILTSPPYNTGRNFTDEKRRSNHEARYDVYLDNKTDTQYMDWTVSLFNSFDKVLKTNGVILYNMSYSVDTQNMSDDYKPHELMYRTVNEIIAKTNFTVADTIIWKKSSALPNNVSPNKLTRIVEFVFVFVRDSEFMTFLTNKQVKSTSKTGQHYYQNVFNFVEAKNNDGANKLNKATYSTELCEKLLSMYARENSIVYDPFMGTGTTAVACKRLGHKFVGSEISENQVSYALERLSKEN